MWRRGTVSTVPWAAGAVSSGDMRDPRREPRWRHRNGPAGDRGAGGVEQHASGRCLPRGSRGGPTGSWPVSPHHAGTYRHCGRVPTALSPRPALIYPRHSPSEPPPDHAIAKNAGSAIIGPVNGLVPMHTAAYDRSGADAHRPAVPCVIQCTPGHQQRRTSNQNRAHLQVNAVKKYTPADIADQAEGNGNCKCGEAGGGALRLPIRRGRVWPCPDGLVAHASSDDGGARAVSGSRTG